MDHIWFHDKESYQKQEEFISLLIFCINFYQFLRWGIEAFKYFEFVDFICVSFCFMHFSISFLGYNVFRIVMSSWCIEYFDLFYFYTL